MGPWIALPLLALTAMITLVSSLDVSRDVKVAVIVASAVLAITALAVAVVLTNRGT